MYIYKFDRVVVLQAQVEEALQKAVPVESRALKLFHSHNAAIAVSPTKLGMY